MLAVRLGMCAGALALLLACSGSKVEADGDAGSGAGGQMGGSAASSAGIGTGASSAGIGTDATGAVSGSSGGDPVPMEVPVMVLRGLAAGAGQYVAVGTTGVGQGTPDAVSYDGSQQQNTVFASSNGTDWDKVYTGAAGGELTHVVYGNDRFVALGSSLSNGNFTNFIHVSEDGLTWSEQALDAQVLGGLAFGNGNFVALDWSDPSVYVSTDGADWQKFATPTQLTTLNFAAGRFVATSGTKVYASETGDVWLAAPYTGLPIEAVYSFDDLFIARSRSTCCFGERPDLDRFEIGISTDGLAWTLETDPPGAVTVPIWQQVEGPSSACIGLRFSPPTFFDAELVSGLDCTERAMSVGIPSAVLVTPELFLASITSVLLASSDGVSWDTVLTAR